MSKLKLNINDKRALSNVVATFLILLLSMIAIGIVYGTVSNILYSIKYSPTLSCIDIMVKNPIEIVSSCYNAETKKIEVELRRSFGNVEINDLKFHIVSSNLYNLVYSCSSETCGCTILGQGEIKKYEFDLSSAGENIYESVVINTNDCIIKESRINPC
ncbi:hypothetical protein COU57_02615 [Candidatus Pacearchaeota archaeon CG10_big_fil_rev_8_21_14_0_10_32_14]|nr:MAG: hypothetical protein COU57_02615 [Candidatus Pacearchaeota archaeon CG10_big_fil_rev_8_21_14_0_10_32_14]